MTLIGGSHYGQIGQPLPSTRDALIAGTTAGDGARFQRASATTAAFLPNGGSIFDLTGGSLTIPDAGLVLNVADTLIDAAGADTAAAMAITTLYHVYLGGRDVGFGPQTLRGSVTAPSRLAGVYYLGTTGVPASWRYVGMVRTVDAGAGVVELRDSLTQRLVASYYGRRRTRIFTCPGYVDDNNFTTYASPVTTHAALNGGTGASVEYLTFGEDAPALHASFYCTVIGAGDAMFGVECAAAIAGTNPSRALRFNALGADQCGSLAFRDDAAVGYRTATLTGMALVAAATVAADLPRAGATADPAATYLEGDVWL